METLKRALAVARVIIIAAAAAMATAMATAAEAAAEWRRQKADAQFNQALTLRLMPYELLE